jgi:hypothetical protein
VTLLGDDARRRQLRRAGFTWRQRELNAKAIQSQHMGGTYLAAGSLAGIAD